ncbi:MAG: histidine phosphatase family protein [Armatimonas sp.]
MPDTLILIKHALPEIVENIPAARWQLGEAGRAATRQPVLRLSHYGIGAMVASEEPKAAETGQIIATALGIPFETLPGLQEHQRETVGWLERSAFETGVRSLFETPDVMSFGEESGAGACSRFTEAIEASLERHSSVGTLAIATHGTVISLFCAARDNRIEGFLLWRLLQLPAYVVLDARTFRVREIIGEPIPDEL